MFILRLSRRLHKRLIFVALSIFCTVAIGFSSAKISSSNDLHRGEILIQDKIKDLKRVHDNEISIETSDKFGTDQSLTKESVEPKGSPQSQNVDDDDKILKLPFCNMMKGNQQRKTVVADEVNLTSEEVNQGSSDDIVSLLDVSQLQVEDKAVLVATLDGRISMLNQNGSILWSVKTGKVFSSTISSLQLTDNGNAFVIPSLTGVLYKFDGENLDPIPLNADSLLTKSSRLSNDIVITGGKELKTYGIDVSTGSVRYECGISGCESPTKAVDSNAEKRPILVVKKQMQTVRAIDALTGMERWNFSVGTHELSLAGITEGCQHGEQRDDKGKSAEFLRVMIAEGIVIGGDKEAKSVWQHKFPSPISQAWVLRNGQLISVDPVQKSPITHTAGLPALYVGMHKQQLYVQESQSTADKLERAFALDRYNERKVVQHSYDRPRKPLRISWKPSKDVPERQNALTSVVATGSSAITTKTLDMFPFFVYEKDETTTFASSNEDVLSDIESTDSESNVDPDEEVDPLVGDANGFAINEEDGPLQVIWVGLWYFWKEILGISLLTAVILNLIIMKPIMRAVRSQTVADMLNWFKKNEEERSEKDSMALVPAYKEPLITKEKRASAEFLSLRNRTASTSSGDSQCLDESVTFSSQYLKEFEPIQCLGRGGFGVVFEAKKKIDDRHYAVKRITLPNREKARKRVMREVKALAQLDHRNIVRYFNAWIENPPLGWLQENDPLWRASLQAASPSPTGEFASDIMSSTDLGGPSNRPDHSTISLPTTPVDDDSYIVFAAHSQEEKESDSNVDALLPTHVTKDEVIPIASSVENSKHSVVSSSSNSSSGISSSGHGFFAKRRPASLSIPGFQEDESFTHDESNNNNNNSNQENHSSTGAEVICTNEIMYLYIQQELCQKRTLQDWLRGEKRRDLRQAVMFFTQIVEAVEYVHSKKLIHRDLKPSNIFLSGSAKEDMIVKIGDFGLATTALAELDAQRADGMISPSETSGSFGSQLSTVVNLTGRVGTHLYASPEQFKKKPYDYKVDIFSLGLIFFELLVYFSTDMERHSLLSNVRKNNFPTQFKEAHPTEHKLISEMISFDPKKRPDATQILARLQNSPKYDATDNTTGNNGAGDKRTPRSYSTPVNVLLPESSIEDKGSKKRFKTRSLM